MSRTLVVLATVLSVAFWYGAAAPVSAGAATVSGPATSVTVFLKAPDAAALRSLAARPVADRSQRLAALNALLPSAAQRAAVVADLKGRGFTVTSQSSWSVTASAPESVVASAFGTRPALVKNPTVEQYRAAIGALPRIPAALQGLVSGAYPTVGGPKVFKHQNATALVGGDIRNADAAPGVTPTTGANDAGLTVATLQLSNWNQSDLTNYATSHSVADPIATNQYKSVTIDGGPGADFSGDVEVDLDQQSILSTAPTAKQQAYFAPNTDAGFNDVFSHVFDDVTGNALATAPDPHIGALSVSWGECENFETAAGVATTEPILDSLVAAGVTIFASSGDDGIYDCRSDNGTGLDNLQEDVDFPTSSPAVVSVGGTRLLPVGAKAANNGSNWTETSWTCTDSVSCESNAGTGGTGGGVSGSSLGAGADQPGDFAGFAKPLYQSATVTSGPFAAPTKRMVPDIAQDGDPFTGFQIYTSDPTFVGICGSNVCQFGGTSLSAPESAAMLTNTLGDAGRTAGIGDIHAALYSGYAATVGQPATASTKAIRDVVSGSNGAAANAHVDPSVLAGPGYDTNSGIGAVIWQAMAPYLFATTGPSLNGSMSVAHKKAKKPKVKATWSSTRTLDVIASTSVVIRQGSKTVFASSAQSGTTSFKGKHKKIYTMTITSVDIAGHSSTKTVTIKVPKQKKHHHHHHHHGH